ncbi:MAG: NAD kinase [Flavobacteriales bacterium]|nr:NAD kinase [Flavobacteriales bacterium]
MKIAIYGRSLSTKYQSFAEELFRILHERQIEVMVYDSFYKEINTMIPEQYPITTYKSYRDIEGVNYLFSIGGDGTLLEATTFVGGTSLPILGINTGRLGFLTTVTTEGIEKTISDIMEKKYELDKRSLLALESEYNVKSNFALNEITLQKKDTSSMITIKAYIDGEYLNTYLADGLIISTPTGSTAYSLSCNGPIILPRSGNIILTPIAPHNLNVRPLVVPDDVELTLKIDGRTENFLIALDSRSVTVPLSTELKIKKSPHYINLIRLEGYDFLDTLRTKLMWGVDKRN